MKLRTKYFIIPALGRLSWDDKAEIKACRVSTKAVSARSDPSKPSCLDEASRQLLGVLQQLRCRSCSILATSQYQDLADCIPTVQAHRQQFSKMKF